MSKEFLFDPSFGFRMEVLDEEDSLAGFVEFFDTPSGMVDIHEVLQWIAMHRIDKRGPQAVLTALYFVFYEPHLQGNDVEIRMLLPDVCSDVSGRKDCDNLVGFITGHETLDL